MENPDCGIFYKVTALYLLKSHWVSGCREVGRTALDYRERLEINTVHATGLDLFKRETSYKRHLEKSEFF